MEQQHHNYESFGFISAAFTESDNFPMEPDDVSKTNFTPDFQAPSDNASLYNLPTNIPTNEYNEATDGNNGDLTKQKSAEDNSTIDIKETTDVAANDTSQNNEEKAENVEQEAENTEREKSEEITEHNDENSSSSKISSKTEHKKDVAGKKRRRIVLLSDEDSDDENLKNEILEKSSDTEEQQKKDTEKSNELGNFADKSGSESEEKEIKGIVNRNFIKAKHLLKTAVVIEDPDKKKRKKKRVLDSDDDDNFLNTTVDDIGLINENETEENPEEESFTDDIVILNDIYDMPQDSKDESENLSSTDIKPEATENVSNENPDLNNEKKPVEQENQEVKKESTPKPDETATKPEEDVEAILDKIEPMDDDDDFFKFNDSSDDEKKKRVSNDEYFGSPDGKSKNTAIRGRKRGPKPGTRRPQNPGSSQKIRKRGDRYDKDFVDDSESSSSSESMSSSLSSSSSSSESSRERVRKPQQRPKQAPQANKLIPIVNTKQYTITKVPPLIKKEPDKQDRFFDKSRNIPNDVYFGDVKVPLHVLHSRWNADEATRSRRMQQMAQMKMKNMSRAINVPSTPSTSTTKLAIVSSKPSHPVKIEQPQEEVKLTVMKQFMKIAGLKINYPKLFNNVKSTDHKCILLRRILNQKGVEGEPTLAKCKQLRRELQAKRESMELDKSVILQTEGRTRRSRRGMQSSEDSMGASNNEVETPTVQPEVLETLTKIKSVIDSDSE